MSDRKDKMLPTDGNWIPESRFFSQEVITETIQGLCKGIDGLNDEGRQSLVRLQKNWMGKMENRQPESNPCPSPPNKSQTKNNVLQRSMISPPEEEEHHNVFDLDDNEVVRNRICIPRLRSKWKLRYFDIMMPAYVLKQGLLTDSFTLEILDKFMESPHQEATAFLQKFIDDVVQNRS
ncbi:moonshiner [Drosophila eugracilis]|uniref:moonshiner n=1 Tax=Drosophila eugracilis TaxID=29029 RepID=UPI0007E81D0E|nr:moonshiner [Drosophila eugracilis]